MSPMVDRCVHLLVPGVTDCERNAVGLQCDQDGQYRASQMDRDSGKAFCVDAEGQRLPWSEAEAPLTDSQCLSTCSPSARRVLGRGWCRQDSGKAETCKMPRCPTFRVSIFNPWGS